MNILIVIFEECVQLNGRHLYSTQLLYQGTIFSSTLVFNNFKQVVKRL